MKAKPTFSYKKGLDLNKTTDDLFTGLIFGTVFECL